MIFISILIPVFTGLILLLSPEWKNRKLLCAFTAAALLLSVSVMGITLSVTGDKGAVTLFNLTQSLPILFKIDGVGRFFAVLTGMVWMLAAVYSFVYMGHEQKEKRYYGFYLLSYAILIGLDFSGNLITFYLFYELMSLLTLPLVLHSGTKEAIMAGLKYLFFSLAGAYMVLFGLFMLNRFGNTLTFTAGGVLDLSLIQGKEGLLLAAAFLMLLGFGVKAGMFPLHAWLPTAHPVAPAPASGILSGIIVKCGVLGVVRTVYYLFGVGFLRGTWIQQVWLVSILITVLLGSMMAYREKVLKKRLAYSTVSQVAYILFGLAMMQPGSFVGAFLHIGAHAFMKCGLFLIAGVIIFKTGKTKVDELAGIGRQMPVTMVCYTLLSLSLIGIPPFAGFVSKWYLGMGSVLAELPVFDVLGPAVLLVSALLTAGYLLPLSIRAFLPGEETVGIKVEKQEPSMLMLIPILLLTVLITIGGLFPGQVIEFISRIVGTLFKEVLGG